MVQLVSSHGKTLKVVPSLPSGEPGLHDGISARLWAATSALAQESMSTPFVTGIADGTLPRSTFQHYLAQDTNYLIMYGNAYATAVNMCRPDQQHVAAALLEVIDKINQEVAKHTEDSGPDASATTVTLVPATTAYTSFLRRISSCPTATLAEVMAAVIPCSRLYGWIGRQLVAKATLEGNPYKAWIDTYGCEEFNQASPILEAILDEVYIPGTYEHLLSIYEEAMRLERNFFAAQPT
ncbi:THI1A [Auxenochlorella protothecoides x Auxenochlorella symbiontica]